MKITVSGNISTGTALPQYVEERLEKEVKKYFEAAVNATVNFSKENHLIHTNIVVNDGTKKGFFIKANADSDDVYSSFDLAIIKIVKQLRKHKSILKDYKKRIREGDVDLYMMEVNSHTLNEISEDKAFAEDVRFDVVEEEKIEIEESTPDEAIMKMDLLDLPAYMFINSKTKKINLVRRRKDGKISWIETNK